MKKILLSLLIFSPLCNAQRIIDAEPIDSSTIFNKWTIEVSAGQAKGVKPYSVGYFSSNPNAVLGSFKPNSFSLAFRNMISPKFGLKFGFHYEDLKNDPKSGSKPFEMKQMGLSVEAVVNASRLFGIEEFMRRWGLLIHGGIKIDQMTSQTPNIFETDHNFDVSEYNGGLVVGISPQFRVTNRLAIYLDISTQNSYRQHFNWDGSFSEASNNLNGQMITGSLGLTFSLGQSPYHGDWADIKDKTGQEVADLTSRLDELETLMNDTDKDGVPDYLDQENNSMAGVAVDTRGKMVDLNNNGVPDELERYVDKSAKETVKQSVKESTAATNKDTVLKLINDGYVATYFDLGKSQPTNVSTEGIDFILTYLRGNPSKSMYILGHADETGLTEKNVKLSKVRAEAVKSILVKSGINGNRLLILPQGEDTSVDPNSEGARKLVRRVTFRIKE